MTIEVDGHVYHEDLVISEKTLAKGGDEMLEKKHQVPQVPLPAEASKIGPVIKTANGARSGMIPARPAQRNNLRGSQLMLCEGQRITV